MHIKHIETNTVTMYSGFCKTYFRRHYLYIRHEVWLIDWFTSMSAQ